MAHAPSTDAVYGAWDNDRGRLVNEIAELRKANWLLFKRESSRQSIMGVRLQDTYQIKEDVRNSQEFKRNKSKEKALIFQMEHQFRREIECPVSVQKCSQKAFHLYLRIAQHEAQAAKGLAYAFTLKSGENYSNRKNLLQYLNRAGFVVEWAIGCAKHPRKVKKTNSDALLQEAFDQNLKRSKKHKKTSSTPQKKPWGRKPRCPNKQRVANSPRGIQNRDQDPTKAKSGKQQFEVVEMLHLHGLAVATKKVKGKPFDVLKKILGENTFVAPITPPKPKKNSPTRTKIKGGRTAALAKGFLAYALYMAKNFDEPCSTKNLKRQGGGRATQKLSKLEKSRIHPHLTRGQLDAFHRAKEAVRVKIGAPKTGKQWWILKYWTEIKAATKPPKYNYDAKVILRDGFQYILRPEWGMMFETVGFRSVACSYERDLNWQEKEADRQRLGLPTGSKPVYEKQGGECELDILLYLSRFPRVIQIRESPDCPIYSYHSVVGEIRPHADKLLVEKSA